MSKLFLVTEASHSLHLEYEILPSGPRLDDIGFLTFHLTVLTKDLFHSPPNSSMMLHGAENFAIFL